MALLSETRAGQAALPFMSDPSPNHSFPSPCAGINRGSYLIKVGMGKASEHYLTSVWERQRQTGNAKILAQVGAEEKKYQRGDLMALFWWELSCPLPARSEVVCLHALRR